MSLDIPLYRISPVSALLRHVDYFRVARDTFAVGNGKQRKARSADREPHDYCGRPVLKRMALWHGSGL